MSQWVLLKDRYITKAHPRWGESSQSQEPWVCCRDHSLQAAQQESSLPCWGWFSPLPGSSAGFCCLEVSGWSQNCLCSLTCLRFIFAALLLTRRGGRSLVNLFDFRDFLELFLSCRPSSLKPLPCGMEWFIWNCHTTGQWEKSPSADYVRLCFESKTPLGDLLF